MGLYVEGLPKVTNSNITINYTQSATASQNITDVNDNAVKTFTSAYSLGTNNVVNLKYQNSLIVSNLLNLNSSNKFQDNFAERRHFYL